MVIDMGSFFKSKIFSRQFIIFLLLILSAFTIIAGFMLTLTDSSLRSQQLEIIEGYRNDAAKQLEAWSKGRISSVKLNVVSYSEMDINFINSRDMTSLIEKHVEVDENLVDILIIDTNGRIANSKAGAKDVDLSERDYYKKGIEGKSHLTGLYKSANNNTIVMAVSEPLFINNKLEFIVVGIITAKRVHEVVDSLEANHYTNAIIVNCDGEVIATNVSTSSYGTIAIEEVTKRNTGTAIYNTQNGHKIFGSYIWIDPLQIGLIVEHDYGHAMRTISILLRAIVLLAIAVLILGIISSYISSKNIVEPIYELIEATSAIQLQDYSTPLYIKTGTELDILTESFNKMQLAIKQREEELRNANNELEEQKREAVEANRIKSQFIANISHELRTPLNSIIGFTEMVLKKCKDILPEVQLENLQIVSVEAHHLLELINNLLDYSKIEAGKMDVSLEKFDLIEVIQEVEAMASPMIQGKPIRYIREMSDISKLMLYSDRLKLKQILINLLSNAYKYSESGTVRLAASVDNDNLYIRISDEGVGISEDNIDNIFDEFRQVDGSYTRKVGGTGLGLSVTRKYLSMLCGAITVESELGKGSVFRVAIPMEHSCEVKGVEVYEEGIDN